MSANGVVNLPLVSFLGISGPITFVEGAFPLPLILIQSSGTPGTQTLHCSGSVTLPSLYFTGTVGSKGGMILPSVIISGVGSCSALGQGSITLGKILVVGAGTAGQFAVGAISLPQFQISATCFNYPLGVGGLVLPGFVISGEGFSLTGDTPEVSYRTVVVNPKYGAVSEYLEFNFDSFCEFPAGVFLATGPAGLYQLYSDSGTDEGNLINAELEFGTTDFGEQTKKNCVDGYINYRGDGLVEIHALADELKDPDIYQTTDVADTRLRDYKFKMSRFREGKNWRFSIKNIEGSNLDINEVAVFYDVLSRRI